MRETYNYPIIDARELGWPKMTVLGFQHMFAMFGATILVPILVNGYFHGEGLSVQVTLFCAGFGTLLFHLLTRLEVPAFLGSSFAFLGGFATVAELDTGIFKDMSYGEKLPYACGGVVVAGLLYLVLALLVRLIGPKKVMKYLPPVVTGPIIICIGLGLAPSAIGNASQNWPLALIALGTVVVFNIWGKGMFRIIPILMGVVIAYIAALIMNSVGFTNADGSVIISTAEIAKSSWTGIPDFTFAKFDLTAILVMAPIAIASMMEHVGDISAISATTGNDFIEDPGLHRTLLGDGLATCAAALMGGPANTTYGENTGVLELSKVHDPLVIRLAAVYALLLSFVPKVSAVIATMPTAIIGGISFILYGMISAIGIRNLLENNVFDTTNLDTVDEATLERARLKNSRNLIIVAVIIVTGLGLTDGLTFNVGGTSVTLTALAVASVVGIFLNAVLPGNDYVFGKNKQGDENSGIHIQ